MFPFIERKEHHMNEIIEYKIIGGRNPEELEKQVNKQIAMGFQPIGGISTLMDSEILYCHQAIVKYQGDSN
jgi:hypothetical protein